MFRYKVRLLLCISILSLIQVKLCYAQDTEIGPWVGDVVYSDVCGTQLSPEEFAVDYTSNVEQSSFGGSSPWFVRFGVATFLFGESAVIRANGGVVPGASIRISDETTFAFDIGYQLSPRWTATLSGGAPPNLDLDGTGPFEGAQYVGARFGHRQQCGRCSTAWSRTPPEQSLQLVCGCEEGFL